MREACEIRNRLLVFSEKIGLVGSDGGNDFSTRPPLGRAERVLFVSGPLRWLAGE
jgi:hypothetical protein